MDGLPATTCKDLPRGLFPTMTLLIYGVVDPDGYPCLLNLRSTLLSENLWQGLATETRDYSVQCEPAQSPKIPVTFLSEMVPPDTHSCQFLPSCLIKILL